MAIYWSIIGHLVEFFSGEKYPAEELGLLTAILSIGFAGIILFYIIMQIFWGLKNPLRPAKIILLGDAILIAGILVLVRLKGLVGMCIGFALGGIIMAFLASLSLKKEGYSVFEIKKIPHQLTSAIITFLLLYLVFPKEGIFSFVDLVLSVFIFLVVFNFIGGVDKIDLDMLREMSKFAGKSGEKMYKFIEKIVRLSPWVKL